MPATITVSQSPSRYNLVVSPNVWVLDSITTDEDAYIMQVLKVDEVASTTEVIATIQQPANPAGVGQFDISKILQAQLGVSWVEDTQEASPTEGMTIGYQIRYGSVTDDVPTYDATSSVYYAFNGYLDWREINWPNASKYILFPTADECIQQGVYNLQIAQRGDYLHNYPSDSITVRSSVYHTLSFANRIGNYDNGTNWSITEQPYAVRIKYYDEGDNLISTTIYAISEQTGLGPRQAFDSSSIGAYSASEWIGTIGAGPQNLKDAGYWPQSSSAIWNLTVEEWQNESQIWNLATSGALVDHYTVEVMSVDACYWEANGAPEGSGALELEPYLGSLMYIQEFQIGDPCTGYDPVTVSFMNQYGVKDYYTFDRRNTYNQRIKRNNYTQVLGSWSDSTFSIDQHGRGDKTFSTQIETNMTMSSYWMDDQESEWLEELFTSPHIQVYYDGVWHPAVITSNSYDQKTNVRNGLFQHTLNIKFANNKKVQRG